MSTYSEKNKKPATVLIVEDDAVMRKHFELAVTEHPDLELFASIGSCKACQELLHKRPDVLLVDIGLPDGSGIALIRELKALYPTSEAMVVSVFDEEKKVIGAIRAGASGYLLKDMLKEDIGASIMEVLTGGSPISPSIARYILKALNDTGDGEIPHVDLSVREREVLQLIARGYSRKEIGSLLHISMHTVVSHTRHIYEKLDVKSKNEAVFEACQQGLINLHG